MVWAVPVAIVGIILIAIIIFFVLKSRRLERSMYALLTRRTADGEGGVTFHSPGIHLLLGSCVNVSGKKGKKKSCKSFSTLLNTLQQDIYEELFSQGEVERKGTLFKCLVVLSLERPEYPEKNLSVQSTEPTNSTHI